MNRIFPPKPTAAELLARADIEVVEMEDLPALYAEWEGERAPRGAGLGVVFLWAAFVTGFVVGLCVGVGSN